MSAGLWWNAHCGPSWGLRSVRSVWGGCVTAVVGKVEVDLGDRAGMVLLRPLDVAAVLAERLEDHLDRPRLAGQDRPIEGRLGVVQAGLAGIVGHLLELRVALNELPDRGAGDAETAGDRGQIPPEAGNSVKEPRDGKSAPGRRRNFVNFRGLLLLVAHDISPCSPARAATTSVICN